jgi:hypothetical protein
MRPGLALVPVSNSWKNLPSPLVFMPKSAFLTLLEATMPFHWLESIARMNIGTLRPLVISPLLIIWGIGSCHWPPSMPPPAVPSTRLPRAAGQLACLLRFSCA